MINAVRQNIDELYEAAVDLSESIAEAKSEFSRDNYTFAKFALESSLAYLKKVGDFIDFLESVGYLETPVH